MRKSDKLVFFYSGENNSEKVFMINVCQRVVPFESHNFNLMVSA